MELIKCLVDTQFSPTEEEIVSWGKNSELYFIETKYDCFNIKRKYSAHIVQDICKKYPSLAISIMNNVASLLCTAASNSTDAVIVQK